MLRGIQTLRIEEKKTENKVQQERRRESEGGARKILQPTE